MQPNGRLHTWWFIVTFRVACMAFSVRTGNVSFKFLPYQLSVIVTGDGKEGFDRSIENEQ